MLKNISKTLKCRIYSLLTLNNSHRYSPNILLIAIIVVGHLHAIFLYGTTFWVDSEAYIFLSKVFESAQKTQSIMVDPKLWLYTDHIPLGEPFIWYLVSKLPVSFIWPAMMLIQHIVGVLSQVYLFSTLNATRSSRLLIIPCLLMSFFPFYQAMHNSLMSEAISGACLLVGIAACLRLAFAPRRRDNVYLALSGLGALFRVYLVVVPFFVLFILFVFRKMTFRRMVVTSGFCAIGLVLSPAWILYTTGQIWIPNLGMNAMWQHSVFASATPTTVTAYVDTLPWPDETVKQRLFSGEFSRFDTIAVSNSWHEAGMTRKQSESVSRKIGALFLEQPGQWKRKINAALVCMGIPEVIRWLPINWQHRRQPDRKQLYAHQVNSYRYFSWVSPSEPEYNSLSSLPFFHDGPEHLLFKEAWQPYLNFSSHERARDILGLSRVPLGLWALLGLGASIFMLSHGRILQFALFAGIFLLLFFSFYSVNIPSIRYAYLAILLYFAAFATAITAPRQNE